MLENLLTNNLLDLEQTIAKDLFQSYSYSWEVLPNIHDFIIEYGRNLCKNKYLNPKENVWISKNANVFESAYIEGPTIIEDGVDVRHCAFIRGNAIIGKNCVVGNSTELKNVILFNNVQVPHYNYVGDSILGYKAHMGAGSITSNVKSDKSLVDVVIQKERIKTGLKKFGAIIGDYAEIGCNAVLNPGTIIGRNSNVYPLTMVRGYVKDNSIIKNDGSIIDKF